MGEPRIRILAAVLGALAALAATVGFPTGAGGASSDGPQGLDQALAAQEANTASLMARTGVIGTAVGVDGDTATVVVLAARPVTGLPSHLDGVAVEVRVTGPISALHHRAGHDGGPPSGGGDDETTTTTTTTEGDTASTVVQVGDSTGNNNECSAGTIAATVESGSTQYFLSNNHVFAREDEASLGEAIVSPGRFDTNCGPSTVVASLSDFEKLHDGGNKKVDAAIAALAPDVSGDNSAPSYGQVSTTTETASLGLAVQKHGRTSGHSTGQVTAINATVNVGYSNGTVTFVNQIIVESNKPFIKSGDSGSLLVTTSGNRPTGLLFAGNINGKLAVANQISDVFSTFGVSIAS